MRERISPAKTISGSVHLPGDKSISHRYGMLASIAEGTSTLRNYSTGADCRSTLECMRALGADIRIDGDVTVEGRGLNGLRAPASELDCGNSGSTMRMLAGLLAAQPFESRLGGDESLSRRPMGRIMAPLEQMGARVEARDGRYPPLTIHGGNVRAIDYTLPVASAQVKSCVLLAGLYAEGQTIVREPMRTRDHTEIALQEFGAEIERSRGAITLTGRPQLRGRDLVVPGDLSSAAFFLVAAQMVADADLTIEGVGLNPTRSRLLDFLAGIGVRLQVLDVQQTGGEIIGNLRVRRSPVRGGSIEGDLTAALIDELPVLAVLGAVSDEGLVVKDAGELRVKETDRIATVADNMARMGVKIETRADGFTVPGKQKFHAAQLDSFGDHRIAMAFSIAALAADGPCEIEGAGAASVSFPEFFDTLRRIAA